MTATERSLPFRLRALGALLAGGLTPLAFAPFDLWPLALIMPALFWLILRDQSPGRSGWLGWCYGLGFYGVGTSWVYVSIHTYGNASVLLAGLLTFGFVAGMALFMAAQGWLYGRLFGRSGHWLGFVGLWVLWEWIRSWLLTGFPWLYLGYPLLDTPLAAWAPVGGVWAASLAALLIGVGGAQLLLPARACGSRVPKLTGTSSRRTTVPSEYIRRGARLPQAPLPRLLQRNQRIVPASLISIVLLGPLLMPAQWTQPAGTPLKVGLVQGDIPQELKWQRNLLPDILLRYETLSRDLGPVDLLVWPETAIPTTRERAEPYLAPFLQELSASGTGLIAGLPSILQDANDPSRRIFHNSLALLTPDTAVYHKQRLVPFGEYVPLESLLRGLIDFFNLPMSSFSLPRDEQGPLPFRDHRFGAAICYEIAYPELVRRESLDADLLLTVSNDTWFGRSFAPDQHLQIARMRARETGRWLIRATNNGISALVGPDGRIRAEAPRYQPALLSGEVEGMQGLTPYQRVGVWPVLMLALFGCLIAARPRNQTVTAGAASQSC
ncbi:MAG: apolipoprotein N-acyltransferase [Oceanospirillaceae bacterium]|nr:apolipoprotein N-acyltransferase [Oceanospirillaceae bacterium]